MNTSGLFPGTMDMDLIAPSAEQPPFIPGPLQTNNLSRFEALLSKQGLLPETSPFATSRPGFLPPDRAPSGDVSSVPDPHLASEGPSVAVLMGAAI